MEKRRSWCFAPFILSSGGAPPIGKYLARSPPALTRAANTTPYISSVGAGGPQIQHYVMALQATKVFIQKHRVFPILVAMERLDAVACVKSPRNSRHADIHLRRLRYVPAGFHLARLHLHGLFALPRHCHLHAAGGIRGGNHGRTHPQFDARTQAEDLLLTVDDPDLGPSSRSDTDRWCGCRRIPNSAEQWLRI
jgi:hypothetical protein